MREIMRDFSSENKMIVRTVTNLCYKNARNITYKKARKERYIACDCETVKKRLKSQ